MLQFSIVRALLVSSFVKVALCASLLAVTIVANRLETHAAAVVVEVALSPN